MSINNNNKTPSY